MGHENEELSWVNYETGEITRAYGRFYSEEQLAAMQLKDKNKSLQKSGDDFIWFLFNYCEEIFPDMTAPNVTRLFYLATFCGYDGKLVCGRDKHPMTRRMVQERLGLTEVTFKRFWAEMLEREILYVKDKAVWLNKDLFRKGKLPAKQLDTNYTRVYCYCVRNMYEQCTSLADQKRLYYIFKIIPFVNRRFNFVCWNPEEQEITNVVPMTTGEFCDMVGYERKNSRRLFKDLLNLKLDNGENVVTYLVSEWDADKWYIILNPRAYYGGMNVGKPEVQEYFSLQNNEDFKKKMLEEKTGE